MPLGLPVVTIIPSRTVKVSDATLTGTQPLRSLPLNSGLDASSARAGTAPATIAASATPRRTTRVFMRGFLVVVESIDDRRGVAVVGRGPGSGRSSVTPDRPRPGSSGDPDRLVRSATTRCG